MVCLFCDPSCAPSDTWFPVFTVQEYGQGLTA